jgi:DNA-binding NtrC family response regulator
MELPVRDGPVTATASPVGDMSASLAGRLRLVVVAGPDQGAWIALGEEPAEVGSAPGSQLRLADAAVSRRHLGVAVTADGIELRDLGSKNGSYYLGARFDVIRVAPGAQVTVGTSAIAVVSEQDDPLPLHPGDRFGRLLGHSAAMRRVFAALDRLAASDASILVVGETGTGKDLAAQAIHAVSGRRERPFVVCDLGAVPAALIESELFGHVRGAFTGADRERTGAFEQAQGGTIFLDEIGELATALQPRLLRVLETRSVKRVGEATYRPLDVRVVAATNRDPAVEIKEQRLRTDLFHRIAVAQVRMPPLREHKDDIPLLVGALVDDLAARDGQPFIVPPETLAALSSYGWPGNVRQLRNVIERAAALAPPDRVLRADVLGIDATPAAAAPALPPSADPGVPFKDAKDRLVQRWEQEYVASLIEKFGDNITQAARVAGIDRAHLYRLMRKHGLQ